MATCRINGWSWAKSGGIREPALVSSFTTEAETAEAALIPHRSRYPIHVESQHFAWQGNRRMPGRRYADGKTMQREDFKLWTEAVLHHAPQD
jgi:hypothetical protein